MSVRVIDAAADISKIKSAMDELNRETGCIEFLCEDSHTDDSTLITPFDKFDAGMDSMFVVYKKTFELDPYWTVVQVCSNNQKLAHMSYQLDEDSGDYGAIKEWKVKLYNASVMQYYYDLDCVDCRTPRSGQHSIHFESSTQEVIIDNNNTTAIRDVRKYCVYHFLLRHKVCRLAA